MTTVINNPGEGSNSDESGSAFGMVIGLIMFFVIAGIFIVYILPMMQNSQTPDTADIKVNVTAPTEETTTP